MKTSLLLSFLVLSFAVRASSQNCSSASMNLDCSPSGACRQTVPCGTVNAENILNTSVTQTYEDVCRNNNNRNIYLDVFSSNTGAGQCTYDAVNVPCGGSGQPACAFAVVNCPPVFSPNVTPATGPADYNRFYNRTYGSTINDNGANPGCNLGSGVFTQDFKQCAGVACQTCSCNACTGQCSPAGCSCPIIMDVLGEGIHLTSLDEGVWFDFNNNGKPMHLAWTDPKYRNAFLALDRNHNSKIDGVQELFGALTQPQITTTAGKPNGWTALAIYDTPAYGGSGDGVIDSKDAIYSQLLLWIDANHDGISQPNELHHLAELNVTAIELKYDGRNSYTDQYGNRFQSQGLVDIGPAGSDALSPDAPAWDVVLRAASPQTTNGATPNCVPH